MSLTSIGFAAEPQNPTRTDRAYAEALLSFMEWGQGVAPLENSLKLALSVFGASSGTITRVQTKIGRSRTIAAADASGTLSINTCPPVGQAIGPGLKHFNIGAPILMSMIEDTKLLRSAEFEIWKRGTIFVDVGFVTLARNQREADLLILHFEKTPKDDWCSQYHWFSASLARAFEVRRSGLVTEALVRKKTTTQHFFGLDLPILAAENYAGLTRTEYKVCILVSRGLVAKSVASEMGVSTTTVRTHLRNIYAKTGFEGFHQLAKRLISIEEQRAILEPTRMSA